MSPLASIILAFLLQKPAAARRVTGSYGLTDASDIAAGLGLNSTSQHQCCADHRYDKGSCPCDTFQVDKRLSEIYCKEINSKRSHLQEGGEHCEHLVGHSNAEIASCKLQHDKCIKCSASQMEDLCKETKQCSFIREVPERKDKLCGLLNKETLINGIIMSPGYAAKLLLEETPRVQCSEPEIVEMCGVRLPCPEIASQLSVKTMVCTTLAKGGKHTLESMSNWLATEKRVACSPKEISSICLVPAPKNIPNAANPCPEFENMQILKVRMCSGIANKVTWKNGQEASYSVASEMLEADHRIKCSAKEIEEICKK